MTYDSSSHPFFVRRPPSSLPLRGEGGCPRPAFSLCPSFVRREPAPPAAVRPEAAVCHKVVGFGQEVTFWGLICFFRFEVLYSTSDGLPPFWWPTEDVRGKESGVRRRARWAVPRQRGLPEGPESQGSQLGPVERRTS